MKIQKLKVGLHRGSFKPLPSTWFFPKYLKIVNFLNMWLRGSTKDIFLPLRYITKDNIEHISNENLTIDKIRQVIKVVEGLGQVEIWWTSGTWSGDEVTILQSGIWGKLYPYISAEGSTRSKHTIDKIRKGNIGWRTCYNNMQKKKLFQGNKNRCAQIINVWIK